MKEIMKRRVVITGMEIASSIGCGLSTFWKSATEGRSGIQRIQAYDPSQYPTQIAGEITQFPAAELPEEYTNSKRYPRVAQYAIYCAQHAIQQSGLTPAELQNAGTYI